MPACRARAFWSGRADKVGSDGRVEIGYISYQAHTAPCGDWSDEPGVHRVATRSMPNFGCAVQHNIAAQVADPRDLDHAARHRRRRDAARRAVVFDNYETGQADRRDEDARISPPPFPTSTAK